MVPGFENFDRIAKGQHLADDSSGPIMSPGKLRIFLPLYQGQGDDGYFLARPVNPFWLGLSATIPSMWR